MTGPIEQWWAEGEVLPITGASIFTRQTGEGPWVTFLHGWPTSSFDYHLVDRLLPHGMARRLHLDLLGFGASDKPADGYTIGRQADIVEAVWSAFGVERTTVVAHDYGTIVAQELLARGAPIDGTLWLNGSIYPEHYRPTDLQQALVDPAVGPDLARSIDHAAFAAGLPAVFGPDTAPSPELIADLWHGISRADGHHRWPQQLAYMAERAADRDRLVAALDASIARIPTHFVWGMADPVSGAPIIQELHHRHPRAAVTALEGAAHYPHLESPGQVAEAVLSLVAGL